MTPQPDPISFEAWFAETVEPPHKFQLRQTHDEYARHREWSKEVWTAAQAALQERMSQNAKLYDAHLKLIKELQAKVARYEETLKWYADMENHKARYVSCKWVPTNVTPDYGQRAREALKISDGSIKEPLSKSERKTPTNKVAGPSELNL